MEKEEILEKSKKKVYVGEMETQNIRKGNMISVLIAGIIAVAFIIIEGVLRHHTAQFAISAVVYAWASVFYFCQYFMAKRPWQVLIGAILYGIAFIAMIALFVVFCVKGW